MPLDPTVEALRAEWQRQRDEHAVHVARFDAMLADLDRAMEAVSGAPARGAGPQTMLNVSVPAAEAFRRARPLLAVDPDRPRIRRTRRPRGGVRPVDVLREAIATLGPTFTTNEAIEAYGKALPDSTQGSRRQQTRKYLAVLAEDGVIHVERVGVPRHPTIWRRGKGSAAAPPPPGKPVSLEGGPEATSPTLEAKKRRLLAARNGNGAASTGGAPGKRVNRRLTQGEGIDTTGMIEDDEEISDREAREIDRFAGLGLGDD